MKIELRETKNLFFPKVLALYKANNWSAADKPKALEQSLQQVSTLISAWHNEELVGLGTALSDGFLVVYYPHLIVHPSYHKKGIGKKIMDKMQEKYAYFHQQVLIAEASSIPFYEKCGFERAANTQSMWIHYEEKE
jgi:GNAT superfamily N-acetyltransferase